ncbi:unnamed protein product [Linum trigynum]|uniref:Uncharacterized protein n=1 Tax=Linum trigynum TaxID=586398 RepID=A0AAV2CZU9_9ROSI
MPTLKTPNLQSTDRFIAHLKRSLAETLTVYYPFSGRTNSGNLLIDRFGESIPLIHVKVESCRLSDFLKRREPENLNCLLPRAPFRRESFEFDSPVLEMQVSIFSCGGIALGWAASHKQIGKHCSELSPSPSPSSAAGSKSSSWKRRRSKLIRIIAPSAAALVVLILVATVLVLCLVRRNGKAKENAEVKGRDSGGGSLGGGGGGESGGPSGGRQGGFSWEKGESMGTLVFLGAGDQVMSYSLEAARMEAAARRGRRRKKKEDRVCLGLIEKERR